MLMADFLRDLMKVTFGNCDMHNDKCASHLEESSYLRL